MTDAERAVWRHIRQQQTGFRFRRQHPIGAYVADFACLERRLIIGVDGGHHGDASDERRDACLHDRGFSVVRLWNTEVLQNMEGVLQVILERLARPSPHPSLPPRAGEGENAP
jgi:primosomal protein N' (replication factor Y)